jgi:hypothetical protein
MSRFFDKAVGERTRAGAAPGGNRFLGRLCRAWRKSVSRPRSRLPGDPGDDYRQRSVVQPHRHISINFDRTGFQEDWNVVFPLDRLNDLAAEGAVGSVADRHYSFMGATDPVQMEPYARELAGRLKEDAVSAAILPPV